MYQSASSVLLQTPLGSISPNKEFRLAFQVKDQDLEWRQSTPSIVGDLKEANLSEANLSRSNLSETFLDNANLGGAALTEANLVGAFLTGANLTRADLRKAKLTGAFLHSAALVGTNLEGADLTSSYVHGVSVWGVSLKGTIQSNLVITPYSESVIQVDNLEVAQFIYLLLNNERIRQVIDTITSKVVLILGRFTPERKAVA